MFKFKFKFTSTGLQVKQNEIGMLLPLPGETPTSPQS
jgi:hypothetical protein